MNRIIKFRIKKDITTPNKTTKSRCNQNQKKKTKPLPSIRCHVQAPPLNFLATIPSKY